jgi:homoserine O-acetyltransferase/O-succinyltransferase
MEAKQLITTKTPESAQNQRSYTFGCAPNEFTLESGEKFGPVTLAYETFGKLNSEKSNAILVLHALTGDAHAAGPGGWWGNLIGEDMGINTDKYFVVCSNVVGGCMGSTGPSSIKPQTGKPYGISFPLVTVGDMVNAQRHLIDHLGIEKLLAVAGGSMGGMQVLQWMTSYPKRIRAAIPIATTMKHTPQQIAFNEVGRQAVMADSNWRGGDYYSRSIPAKGLAIARMIGHITYMSDASMTDKFGRKFRSEKAPFKFGADFEVEGYLRNRGDNFVKRFDANSYLYITKAIDYFNILNGHSLGDIFRGLQAKVLVLAFKSDWLYPAYQSQEIAKACKLAGVDASYCELNSTYGHDAFLLETQQEAHLISNFLNRVHNNGKEHNNR